MTAIGVFAFSDKHEVEWGRHDQKKDLDPVPLRHIAAKYLRQISSQATARDRKGIECELIAAYRKAKGSNPACQFARDLEIENDDESEAESGSLTVDS